MESTSEPPKPRDMRKIILAVIVAAIIVSAALVAFLWYTGRGSTTASTPTRIVSGDSVEMTYIGRLADGRVFDTSRLDVAANDVLYPKSLTFTLRANDTYGTFNMTAGKYGSGGTIKGFALGVIGMRVNETKIVEVGPDEGYAVDPGMLRTIPLQEEILGTETFSEAQFVDAFGSSSVLFKTYTHFFWGWQVKVVDNSSDLVTIRHEPTVGATVYPYGDPTAADSPAGWPVHVLAYDGSGFGGAGKITISNEVSASDVYNIKGTDFDGLEFVLSDFNSTAGTIQIHKVNSNTGYNGELAGRTLFFEITIVKVTHSEA
jgi:FKBP-type peptidyl-prolyl cis-trans isomerase 2